MLHLFAFSYTPATYMVHDATQKHTQNSVRRDTKKSSRLIPCTDNHRNVCSSAFPTFCVHLPFLPPSPDRTPLPVRAKGPQPHRSPWWWRSFMRTRYGQNDKQIPVKQSRTIVALALQNRFDLKWGRALKLDRFTSSWLREVGRRGGDKH